MSKGLRLTLGAVLLLLLALSLVAWCPWSSPQPNDPVAKPLNSRDVLSRNINEKFRKYRRNGSMWGVLNFGFVIGAAILSASAGVFIKLEFLKDGSKWKTDFPAAMAALAAILITAHTLGSFEEKWKTNRIAASDVECLQYELSSKGADGDISKIYADLQDIITAHIEGIVGNASKP